MRVSFLLFFLVAVHGFRTVIERGKQECFFVDAEEISDSTILECGWFVMEGGDRDIKVRIFGPNSLIFEKYHIEADAMDGHYTNNQIMKGSYRICFDNSDSFLSDKKIDFHIIVRNKLLAKSDVLSSLQGANFVDHMMNEVLQLTKEYRVRESTLRNTAESANTRIQVFSILLMIVIVASSFVQSLLLKAFFRTPKKGKF